MTIKRKIYILIFSIIIYFTLNYIYTQILNKPITSKIYLLKESKSRGMKITNEDITEVNILSNLNLEEYVYNTDDLENMLINDNYSKGQILHKSMFVEEKEYINVTNDKEVISVSIENQEGLVGYKLQKGSLINLYYTGKLNQAKDILNGFNSNIISEGSLDGHITTCILENIKILDVVDKYGNSILDAKVNTEVYNFNNIIIETTKDNIMKINNLKEYGKFSITLKK